MSWVMLGVAVVGGAAKMITAAQGRKARKLEKKLAQLEANRQEIINPYQGVTSLSAMLSNPFEKLTVAYYTLVIGIFITTLYTSRIFFKVFLSWIVISLGAFHAATT